MLNKGDSNGRDKSLGNYLLYARKVRQAIKIIDTSTANKHHSQHTF